jgi:hypothetical protein
LLPAVALAFIGIAALPQAAFAAPAAITAVSLSSGSNTARLYPLPAQVLGVLPGGSVFLTFSAAGTAQIGSYSYQVNTSSAPDTSNCVDISPKVKTITATRDITAQMPTTNGTFNLNLQIYSNSGCSGPIAPSLFSGSATNSIVITTIAAQNQNLSTGVNAPLNVTLTAITDPIGVPLTFSVAGNPSNGSLSGTAPNLTYTPNNGFNGIDSFTFTATDGTTTSNIGTISITVGSIVTTHSIVASAGSNGSISPSGFVTVNDGNSQSFTISPDAGYHVDTLLIDGSPVATSTSYTFNSVTSDHTIEAAFAADPIAQYTLTYTAGAHGSISGTSPQTVNAGSNGTAVTAIADAGYHFVNWSDASTANPRTDTNVNANISVTASFAVNPAHTITATAGSNGSISPSGAVTVADAGNQSFAITADAGYHVADVLVNGVSVGAVPSYSFTNVTSDQAISVSFALDPDVTPPAILSTSIPADITIEATGPSGADVSFAVPTATDSVDGNVAVTCAPASGSTFAIGTTTVTCSATDSSNNTATATFKVIVVDTTAPIIALNGSATIDLSLGDTYAEQGATATDIVDGADTVTIAGATVDTSTIGTYVVTYDAVDAAGNHAVQVTRTVNVRDTVAPTFSNVPSDITVHSIDPSGAVVTFTDPTATDNIDPAVTVSCAPASGSTFAYGTTTVYCTSTDSANNTGTSTFDVGVYNYAPVADDQSVGTNQNVSFNIILTANDADGDPITYSIVGTPSHGTLGTVNGTVVSYAPDNGFTGADSFTFKVNDGQSDSNTAIVSVSVNTPSNPPSNPGGGGGGGGSSSSGGGYGSCSASQKLGILDFNTLVINWGATGLGSAGDFNCDGNVDILDFNRLLSNWSA